MFAAHPSLYFVQGRGTAGNLPTHKKGKCDCKINKGKRNNESHCVGQTSGPFFVDEFHVVSQIHTGRRKPAARMDASSIVAPGNLSLERQSHACAGCKSSSCLASARWLLHHRHIYIYIGTFVSEFGKETEVVQAVQCWI